MNWYKTHETKILRWGAIAALAIILILSGRDTFCNWYYSKTVIVPEEYKKVDYSLDTDWEACIFNCALQINVKPRGVCAAVCDQKYTKSEAPK